MIPSIENIMVLLKDGVATLITLYLYCTHAYPHLTLVLNFVDMHDLCLVHDKILYLIDLFCQLYPVAYFSVVVTYIYVPL